MRAGEVPFMRSRAFAAACRMPPGLRLYSANDKFDISESEVVTWLIAQPEILDWVFEQFRMSGALIFNWGTGTWGGNSAAVLFGDERKTRWKNTSPGPAGQRVQNDSDRLENEMRMKAFIACIALPASVDYETLEHLIQREVDALGVGQFRLHCELAEIAIEILDEIGCHDVFLGTNINLVCPLAYRYGQILCDKHRWAGQSDPFTLHEVLTSIISGSLNQFKIEERILLTGALLEEIEPRCGHWDGFREKLVAVVGNRALEMITMTRAEIIAAWDQLERVGCVIEEGEPNYERIPKAGPHFE